MKINKIKGKVIKETTLIQKNPKSKIKIYLKLQEEVINSMKIQDWFGTFSEEDLIRLTGPERNSKIWMYFHNNKIACAIILIPTTIKNLEAFEHLHINANQATQIGQIMVHPDYRGNKLQSQMIKIVESYAKEMGIKYFFATVHPDNSYSLENFKENNYKVISMTECTKGPRALIKKELEEVI